MSDADSRICKTASCHSEPTHRVFWPGEPPSLMCESCRDRALSIADAMGFHLHTEAKHA